MLWTISNIKYRPQRAVQLVRCRVKREDPNQGPGPTTEHKRSRDLEKEKEKDSSPNKHTQRDTQPHTQSAHKGNASVSKKFQVYNPIVITILQCSCHGSDIKNEPSKW